MESEFRESTISFSCGGTSGIHHKKLEFNLSVNFGKFECAKIQERIASFDLPRDYTLLVENVCESAEAAKVLAESINKLKKTEEAKKAPLSFIFQNMKACKAKDKTLIYCRDLENEAETAKLKSNLETISDILGDFESKSQYLNINFHSLQDIKSIFTYKEGESFMKNALNSASLTINAMLHKQIWKKLSEVFIHFYPHHKKDDVKFVFQCLACFHHAKLNFQALPALEGFWNSFPVHKIEEIVKGLTAYFDQLEIFEPLKQAGSITHAYFTLPPFLSGEIILKVPHLTQLMAHYYQ
jgi:hypothetical protein